MSVIAGSVGIHLKFVRKLKDNQARTNTNQSPRGSTDSNILHSENGV